MKKIVLLVFAIFLAFGPAFLIMVPEMYAYTPITPRDPGAVVTVERGIEVIFNTAFWLLLMVSGLFFLFGAYNFLTGGTNPDNVKKGQQIITYAIIALVVAILARGLAAFIPRMFGIT